jgi:hypothetical protein
LAEQQSRVLQEILLDCGCGKSVKGEDMSDLQVMAFFLANNLAALAIALFVFAFKQFK